MRARRPRAPRLSRLTVALRRAWPLAWAAPLAALANPSGGAVVAGTAQIGAPNAQTVQVDQSSARAIINWQQFSVGAGETVVFNQPSASATVLNRVTGGSPSDILGRISANGRVFLINPQGVLFGEGSQVDVGGLVASTLAIRNADFLADRYVFVDGGGSGIVSNAGSLTAASGGYVVLAGERVENRGAIATPSGSSVLAAAGGMTFSFDPAGRISYTLDAGALAELAGVDQSGSITADGGRVVLAARVAHALAGAAVNHTGITRAAAIADQGGEIVLQASGDDLALAGTLAATTLDARSSRDITGAASLQLAGDATLKAGRDLHLDDLAAGGDVKLTAGRDVVLGDVSAARLGIAAYGGSVTTGSLAVTDLTRGARLSVYGVGGVHIGGDVHVLGERARYASAYDGVQGTAAYAWFSAENNGVTIDGTLDVRGTLHEARVADDAKVYATFLGFYSPDGQIRLDGPVQVSGELGSVVAGSGGDFAGAEVSFDPLGYGNAGIALGSSLSIEGHVGSVRAVQDFIVDGAYLFGWAFQGPLSVAGAIDVSGRVDQVRGYGSFTVTGANTHIESYYHGVDLLGPLHVSGDVGAVRGRSGVTVAGASLDLLSETDLHLHGDLVLDGHVADYHAGGDGGVVGAYLRFKPYAGKAILDGALDVDGRIDALVGGSGVFGVGALATVEALGQNDRVRRNGFLARGPVSVHGAIGSAEVGNYADLSGATFWIEAQAGNVDFESPLQLDGHVGSFVAGNTVSVNGARLFAQSFDGTLSFGDLRVTGAVDGITAAANLTASGAELLLQGFYARSADGASIRFLGDVYEQGTLGNVSVQRPDTSSLLSGAVLADAGSSGIHFGRIEGDNVYLYFDADSHVGDASVVAREYLEIFTASLGPTLYADSLSLSAPRLFLSANVDAGTLSAQADDGLTVYFALLHAHQLDLHAGGDLSLIGFDPQYGPNPDPSLRTEISGDLVRISGRSIYGDALSTIDAGGLDLRATDTIFLDGAVHVGTGSAGVAGDPALIARLAQLAPDLVPSAAAPNAFISAHNVALADFSLDGDWLQIESDYTYLGAMHLATPGTLVHLDPRVQLPFFAESVDVDRSGLASVRDRIRTDGENQVSPNFGSFNDALGNRPSISSHTALSTGSVDFTVTPAQQSFGQLILSSGLADSTLVIGASDYGAAIQISDQLAVDLRPTHTNVVVMTQSVILGMERILTNGQVVRLDGRPVTAPEQFYRIASQQIAAYYAMTPQIQRGTIEQTSDGDDSAECD